MRAHCAHDNLVPQSLPSTSPFVATRPQPERHSFTHLFQVLGAKHERHRARLLRLLRPGRRHGRQRRDFYGGRPRCKQQGGDDGREAGHRVGVGAREGLQIQET